MLAHALALRLLAAEPAPVPALHVLPPLELAGPSPALGQAERTPPAAAEPPQASPRAGFGRTYGAAVAGTVVSDLVFVGAFAAGAACAFDDLRFFEGRGASAGCVALLLGAAAGYAFATPAVTVWAAQRAAGRERPGLAYAAVFAVRALGLAVGVTFPVALLVTELVAAPLLAAAIVAGGTPTGQRAAPPPGFPEEPAPAPRPAAGGQPLTRLVCSEAAFAAR